MHDGQKVSAKIHSRTIIRSKFRFKQKNSIKNSSGLLWTHEKNTHSSRKDAKRGRAISIFHNRDDEHQTALPPRGPQVAQEVLSFDSNAEGCFMKKVIMLSLLSVVFIGCDKKDDTKNVAPVAPAEQTQELTTEDLSGKMEGHKVEFSCIPKSITAGEPTLVATVLIPDDENDAYKFKVERKTIKDGKIEASEVVSEDPVVLSSEDEFRYINKINGLKVDVISIGAFDSNRKSIMFADGTQIECDNLKADQLAEQKAQQAAVEAAEQKAAIETAEQTGI